MKLLLLRPYYGITVRYDLDFAREIKKRYPFSKIILTGYEEGYCDSPPGDTGMRKGILKN